VHIEGANSPDEHLFEVTDVAMNIAAVRTQSDDRIADELTRAVVSHVAAPRSLVQLDPKVLKLGWCDVEIFQTVSRAHAEGHHVRMLDEQQHIRNLSGVSFGDKPLLKVN
jgi:hypothetical protein